MPSVDSCAPEVESPVLENPEKWRKKLQPTVLPSEKFSKTLKFLLKSLDLMMPIMYDEDRYAITLHIKNVNATATHLFIYPTNKKNIFYWDLCDEDCEQISSGTSSFQEILDQNKSGNQLYILNGDDNIFFFEFSK